MFIVCSDLQFFLQSLLLNAVMYWRMVSKMHILGISGSLRTGSYNTALLHTVMEMLPENTTMEVFDLHPIPMYSKDEELKGFPEIVQVLKDKIRSADALIISCPEYNHSVTGALKNAIDWASRRGPGEMQSVFDSKPVALASCVTGQWGGIRGQKHLHDIASGMNMYVLNRPIILIAQAAQKFDEQGHLVDETTREFLRQMLTNLVDWTHLLSKNGTS